MFFSMTMCEVLQVSNQFDLLLPQRSAEAALVLEKMTSCILMLVESLSASSVAAGWQTHRRAECLQEESEAIQKLFVGVSLQWSQTGMLVLLLTLLCTEKVQELTFNG